MSSIDVNWVIASRRPESLALFYAFACDGEIRSGFVDGHFLVFKREILIIQTYKAPSDWMFGESGRTVLLCLQKRESADPLDEINHWISQLVVKGANIIGPTKNEPFGSESLMEDPEGNCFLIYVPSSS